MSAPPSYGAFAPQPSMMPGAGRAMSQLMLRIGGRDLKKMDTFSESDPMCVVSLKSVQTGGRWKEVGRTERIKDTKNPDFATTLEIDYYFEEIQELKFDMYDSDAKAGGGSLTEHDFIGGCDAHVGTIVMAMGGTWVADLKSANGKVHGKVHVEAEEHSGLKGNIHMQCRGTGLDKKDFWGKSDPYFELQLEHASGNGSFSTVYRSQHIMKTLNPTWSPLVVSLTKLCNGDKSRRLKIAVWDWDSDGSNDFIGSADTTLDEMLAAGVGKQWDLINPKKMPGGKKYKASKHYKNSGVFELLSISFIEEKGFVEHLRGGLELNFSVAVDFTGSNGDPKQSTSLHFLNPHAPNSYETAMWAVGSVIADYDHDKVFPSYGFGAKVPWCPQPGGKPSHCFSLTGNEANPNCSQVAGIVNMYRQCIPQVVLWGPTHFAPIIQKTSEHAQQAVAAGAGNIYYVLLILTDGAITDMPQTTNAIVAASHLPISIIIVGVGNADFSSMNILDGDGPDGLRNSRGEKARRDIVQFVPINEFLQNPAGLAKEVLEEVPMQVCEYLKAHPMVGTSA